MLPTNDQLMEMFNYLRGGRPATLSRTTLFVFGRYDTRVADKCIELVKSGDVLGIVLSGGIGKDSGALTELNIPEAHYLASLMLAEGVNPDLIKIDILAKNGGDNCRNGLALIALHEMYHANLTVVAHATSARRLAASLEVEAQKAGLITTIGVTATDYRFDPENPIDRDEAVAEMVRLADWPDKGWCTAQDDLPLELVELARSQIEHNAAALSA